MQTIGNALYSTAQIREIEQRAIKAAGSPGELMAKAGRAAYSILRQSWPTARRVVVFCGTGNNGGDGYVVAQVAAAAGLRVYIVAIGDPGSAEARVARADALKAGAELVGKTDDAIREGDVVVDALLGIGCSGELRAPFRDLIEWINKSNLPCLAIDVPSGLDADRGTVHPVAVKADRTITFIGLKLGLFTGKARDYAGDVYLDPLVSGSASLEASPWGRLIDDTWVRARLPKRWGSFHKGDAGHLVVVGGGIGMPGAASLCGLAGLRSGAGRVSVGCHPDSVSVIGSRCSELMVHPIRNRRDLASLLHKADVVAVGPGLGQDSWAQEIFGACLESKVRKVVDADGLNLLAQEPKTLERCVLTPHPGEASRLLGCPTEAVEADRAAALDLLCDKYCGVTVLKGAGTLVGSGEKGRMVCTQGNPGMASAGLGDVLTGVIASLAAQGLDLFEAAAIGTWWHACAGDQVGQIHGSLGLLASEVAEHLPRVIR